MAWIELHQAVWTHRKTFELASILDLDETYAAAHVVRLWTWALDNAPEGDLSGLSDRAIAFGAGWRGKADQLVAALIEAGWLDPNRHIHDWDDYALKLIERRKANAERMRRARAAASDELDSEGAENVQRTSGDSSRERVELPDRTGPNSTGPDRTGPPSQTLPATERGGLSAHARARPAKKSSSSHSAKNGAGPIPTDPSEYLTGTYGAEIAKRMAGRLAQPEE